MQMSVAGQQLKVSQRMEDVHTSCSCLGEYPSPPIQPIPPALDTAAASGPPDVRAMPASITGYLIPSNLHSGVFRDGGEEGILQVGNAIKL